MYKDASVNLSVSCWKELKLSVICTTVIEEAMGEDHRAKGFGVEGEQ